MLDCLFRPAPAAVEHPWEEVSAVLAVSRRGLLARGINFLAGAEQRVFAAGRSRNIRYATDTEWREGRISAMVDAVKHEEEMAKTAGFSWLHMVMKP